jgi:hypothetical protein
MKRFILIALIISFAFCVQTSAYAANEEVVVFVDGNKVQSDVPAMTVNNSTMLPFRAILNAIGISDDQMEWRESSQSIVVRTNNKFVFLVIGSPGAIIDQQMVTLNAAPFIINNRTMIPVRFVSEAFGADVEWDGINGRVNIKTHN